MHLITSKDNSQVKAWRRLAQETTAYRKTGQFWLEGDHLCRAALERGVRPQQVVLTESLQAEQGEQWAGLTDQFFVLPDTLFESLSGLESPARMGFVVSWAAEKQVLPDVATVVLDRLQDAGNVGAILRDLLQRKELPQKCAWVFGHEGQGVSDNLMALARQKVRIAQPGGEESLNVATAAAICLHASATAAF